MATAGGGLERALVHGQSKQPRVIGARYLLRFFSVKKLLSNLITHFFSLNLNTFTLLINVQRDENTI